MKKLLLLLCVPLIFSCGENKEELRISKQKSENKTLEKEISEMNKEIQETQNSIRRIQQSTENLIKENQINLKEFKVRPPIEGPPKFELSEEMKEILETYEKKTKSDLEKEKKNTIFEVINHPKSKGLNFSIKEPVDFERKDSKNNDIVYTWMKGKEMMININIKEMPGFDLTKNECIQMLQDENTLEELADMVNAEKAEYIIIDSYPGFKIQFYDGESYFHKSISLYIDDKMFTLAMLTGKESRLDIYKEDFLYMANSLVFHK